ncbi:hypothetical protein [Paenibacillus periandrae]|uniref:hypothetical protein n=1 Tax=Paenibacillus periandrae TaxID=1761741 RepID=UPI001F09B401|nr:hypothetical protein [Paenibacillus periandrae]
MENRNNKVAGWSFEKEIVFEGGAAIAISISYSNATPRDAVKIISGLEIISKQVAEKVALLKEVVQ